MFSLPCKERIDWLDLISKISAASAHPPSPPSPAPFLNKIIQIENTGQFDGYSLLFLLQYSVNIIKPKMKI